MPFVGKHRRSTIKEEGDKVSSGRAGLKMPVSFITFSAHRKAQWSCKSERKREPLVVCKVQIVVQAMGSSKITQEKVS